MAKIPSILIVDPDLSTRAEVKKAVTRSHFAVAGESGLGIDAITMARTVQPDIVLLACEEPLSPAFQTLEHLGNALPETPAIVYSSVGSMETVRRTVLAGARDFLPKPLNSAELSRSIYSVLEAEEKRRMRYARQTEDIPAQGVIITVAGLKGGVGKSTIAVNLAIALRQKTGQSVALVDAEPNYGDVATLLDLDDIPLSRSISQAARLSAQLDRNSVQDYMTAHSSGISVLPTATQIESWQVVQPSQVEQVVRLIAQTQDYVVVDTPAGLHPITGAVLEAASLALLVTTTDITSLKDTMLALKMLGFTNLDREKVKVVLNHTNGSNGVHSDDVKQVLEQDIFWNTPYDPITQQCSQLGRAVTQAYPDSKISQSIAGLAQAVSGNPRAEGNFRLGSLFRDLVPKRATA